MMSSLKLSKDKLDDFRLRLLVRQLESACENVPFYETFFREQKLHPRDITGITDLSKLPIVTKEIILQDAKQFINRHYPAKKCRISFSSGSTGEPFRSYFDLTSWFRKKYYSKLRARHKCGLRVGEKIAIFEAETPDKLTKKNSLLRYIRLPYHVQIFSIFDDLDVTYEKVTKFNPQNYYGPPGYLFHLAQTQSQHATQPKKLKRIFTASEYLSQNVRDYLERSFHVFVFDHYGCTETKEVAWQCHERNGYHINEDEVICEILDGSNAVPDGEVGDIVLTDLRNRAMPFIRYRIGDRGMMLKESCPCGLNFKLMRPVAGRDSEYIFLPGGERLSPYLLTTAIEKVSGLLKYQIIQKDEKKMLVKVVIETGMHDISLKQIEDNLQQVVQNKLEVVIEVCDQIGIGDNGKFKVVKNEMVDLEKENIK